MPTPTDGCSVPASGFDSLTALLARIANALTAGGTDTGGSIVVTVGGEFSIPAFDYQAFTYYGSTNNIQTRIFKSGGSGGTTVATLTYTYVGSGVVNDDLIATVTQS